METLEKEIVGDETIKSNHMFNGFKEESKEFDPLTQEEVPKVFYFRDLKGRANSR